MRSKQERGQFFTTRSDIILQNLRVPEHSHVIEPFCGKGDLVRHIPNSCTIELYDIEPQYPNTIARDCFADPPTYRDAFILTNPPYLARNKTQHKDAFERYKLNDLYKCFLAELCSPENLPIGGICIVPLNFWCSQRRMDADLRAQFLVLFTIERMNLFTYPVFEDTNTAVCAFQFSRNAVQTREANLFTVLDQPPRTIPFSLDNALCMVGGELFELPTSTRYTCHRVVGLPHQKAWCAVKCLDGLGHDRIRAFYHPQAGIVYCDTTQKASARCFMALVLEPDIAHESERCAFIEAFNTFLEQQRALYNSLFLTSYREGERKRISFALVYRFALFVLKQSVESS